MSWKRGLIHALVSAALASVACIIYDTVYSSAFFVDFSAVLNTGGIIGSCTLGCVLMSVLYVLATKWRGERIIIWVNILISVLSFASIISVLAFSLPLDIDSPEMFPGLAIPMHFFSALSFLTVSPIFRPK